jgi:hypothetical protein
MLDMQLRELRWGDPFHPATPEELAATAGALIRVAIPNWLMARQCGPRDERRRSPVARAARTWEVRKDEG